MPTKGREIDYVFGLATVWAVIILSLYLVAEAVRGSSTVGTLLTALLLFGLIAHVGLTVYTIVVAQGKRLLLATLALPIMALSVGFAFFVFWMIECYSFGRSCI
jgi:hypothetical protein